MMTAIVQTAYGDPEEVLEQATVERPTGGPDDVLVRVEAAGVNTPDWIAVTGVPYVLRMRFGLRGPGTPVRGSDVAGVVESVGTNVTDLGPGDEVFGSTWADKLKSSAGTFAELTIAPAPQLIRKPGSLSFAEAAGSVMSGITALVAMRDVGQVSEGTRVLINGASGGVGTMAVQIAKARGGHVTGVCSGANVDLVRSLGADEVIDYTEELFYEGDARYDVVMDNVLNHPPSKVARVLDDDGVLIPNSVGNTGGLLAGLPRIARATLMGLGPRNVKSVTCEVNHENLTELAGLLESGAVKVIIDGTYPLKDSARAVARMLSHRARGNIVIVP